MLYSLYKNLKGNSRMKTYSKLELCKDNILKVALTAAFPVKFTREHCYNVLKQKAEITSYDKDIDNNNLILRKHLATLFAIKHTDAFYYSLISMFNE